MVTGPHRRRHVPQSAAPALQTQCLSSAPILQPAAQLHARILHCPALQPPRPPLWLWWRRLPRLLPLLFPLPLGGLRPPLIRCALLGLRRAADGVLKESKLLQNLLVSCDAVAPLLLVGVHLG